MDCDDSFRRTNETDSSSRSGDHDKNDPLTDAEDEQDSCPLMKLEASTPEYDLLIVGCG